MTAGGEGREWRKTRSDLWLLASLGAYIIHMLMISTCKHSNLQYCMLCTLDYHIGTFVLLIWSHNFTTILSYFQYFDVLLFSLAIFSVMQRDMANTSKLQCFFGTLQKCFIKKSTFYLLFSNCP
jgi:hypothetical protein